MYCLIVYVCDVQQQIIQQWVIYKECQEEVQWCLDVISGWYCIDVVIDVYYYLDEDDVQYYCDNQLECVQCWWQFFQYCQQLVDFVDCKKY